MILDNLYMSGGVCRWLHLSIISNGNGLLIPLTLIKLLLLVTIVIVIVIRMIFVVPCDVIIVFTWGKTSDGCPK